MIRPTVAYFLSPKHFVDTDFDWHSFDFKQWSSEEYEWGQDEWRGLKDTVKEPTTVLSEYGDCDDYSVVALSHLLTTTDHPLLLVSLYSLRPLAGHMVAYDEQTKTVYSSGNIREQTLEEYKAESKYSYHLSRRVR